MLSRAKPAVGSTPPQGDRRRKKGKKVPQLEELLAGRDFTGAIALLEVTGAGRGLLLPWEPRAAAPSGIHSRRTARGINRPGVALLVFINCV